MLDEADAVSNNTDDNFDHGAALSQRDKKIAELQAENEQMQQRLATTETDRELSGSDTSAPSQSDKSEPSNDPLMERLERIEKSLGSFTQNNFDSQFKLGKRVKDEAFLEWAKQPVSPLVPNSPTLEQTLLQARENGDFATADSILEAWDKKNRGGVDSQSPNFSQAQPQTAQQKKNATEIASLKKQREQAFQRRDNAKVKELTDSIRNLKV